MQGSEGPGEGASYYPARGTRYNSTFPDIDSGRLLADPSSPCAMEAEQINQIANTLIALALRTAELRRYL
jgi:hypothetical protein